MLTTYSKEAELSLSHAVKQDPLIVDAWNCLGESYWKQGNVQQAYHCFLGGLSHVSGYSIHDDCIFISNNYHRRKIKCP